jgi:hypothetical protein
MPWAASTMTGAVVTSSSSITRGFVNATYAKDLRAIRRTVWLAKPGTRDGATASAGVSTVPCMAPRIFWGV